MQICPTKLGGWGGGSQTQKIQHFFNDGQRFSCIIFNKILDRWEGVGGGIGNKNGIVI